MFKVQNDLAPSYLSRHTNKKSHNLCIISILIPVRVFIALYSCVIKIMTLSLIVSVIDSKFWLYMNISAVLESINLLHSSDNTDIILLK